MPTYDYQCPICKKQIEINHSINNQEDLICSTYIPAKKKCKGILEKRFITAPCLTPQSVPTRRRYQYMKKR